MAKKTKEPKIILDSKSQSKNKTLEVVIIQAIAVSGVRSPYSSGSKKTLPLERAQELIRCKVAVEA